jgi:hypothetical protein
MAAPTIVAGHTTNFETANVNNHDINTPNHLDGDMIYIFAALDSPGVSMSPPPGFAVVNDYDNVSISNVAFFSVWRKPANSEGGNYVWTSNTAERSATISFAVRGGPAIHSTGTNATGSSSSATIPAVVTSVIDTLRISAVFTDDVSTPHSTPAGYTELAEISTTSGASISIQYKTLASSGTSASEVVTITSEQWVGISFALAATANERVTQAGVYIELGGGSAAVTQAGLYLELISARINATQAGLYLELVEPKILATQLGLYLELEEVTVLTSRPWFSIWIG